MTIDGKAIAQGIKEALRERASCLAAAAGRPAGLAVILVGDDPASHTYVRSKIKAAEFVGIKGQELFFPASASQDEILGTISSLNADDTVDGILVQLPLPRHIDTGKVLDSICPAKDVDGFHPANIAALQLGRPCIIPCTPKGIMRLIDSTSEPIEGKHAVVVGRSNIVGKPLAKLLLDRNATVTVAHSHTTDLAALTRTADILISATGVPGLIGAGMIKPGAIVIDVGIHRNPDGTLAGDVDWEEASKTAGWITPVPGGVGPMTVAMLMENTLDCLQARLKA